MRINKKQIIDIFNTSFLKSETPSFEMYNSCPNTSMGFTVEDWFNGASLTPDYYNICNNTPMYIGVELTVPLHLYSIYYLSFNVSLSGSSSYGTPTMGAYFSSTNIFDLDVFLLKATPQIINKQDSLVINDDWQEISGYYTTRGGESYLTIGNYSDDINNNLQQARVGGWNQAYYCIDNVSLKLVREIEGGNVICLGDSTTIHFYDDTSFVWVDSLDPTTILSTDSSITVSPKITTTYLIHRSNDTLSCTLICNRGTT